MLEELLLNLKNEALALISQAKNEKELEELRIRFLGRKGRLKELTKKITKLPPEGRVRSGRLINNVKTTIQDALNQALKNFQKQATSLDQEWLDVTAPGKKPPQGHLHLVTQAIEEISSIFEKIGFVRVSYPEVEWDWYAFEGLNMPKGHPARDEWETFFINAPENPKLGKMVLTPHTSSGQLREMERTKPPIRMINIGKCYRRQMDISHLPMFHQFEGLVIDKNISIPHLKGTIEYFIEKFFGPKRKIRFRPFHFRFTEPSFEIDINCEVCHGKGCRFCRQGWVELAGAGMVHPVVLKNGGINPEKYSGFAFGWGVERTYMMREGLKIGDIRLLYNNDLRFLDQF